MNHAKDNLNATALRLLLHTLPEVERLQLYQLFRVVDENSFVAQLQSVPLVKQLVQRDEYNLRHLLLLYVPPILPVIGTIGNLFSFAVLMMPSMRRMSTYLYLAALSVTDTLVLFIGLLRIWIGALQGYDIWDRVEWVCKSTNMLGYTVSDYSVWLIIAVTVERYVAVCHRLRAAAFCNRSRAVKVMMSLCCMMIALNLQFFWTTNIRETSQQTACSYADGYKTLIVQVWPWVDAALYSFLPSIVIMFLNVCIILRVLEARRRGRTLSQPPDSGATSPACARRSGGSSESSSRLTVMLLCISFAYLAMTMPVNIMLIATRFWNASRTSVDSVAKLQLARTITELFVYLNHSSNFFLYCATGHKFRRQICVLLCRRWRRAGALA